MVQNIIATVMLVGCLSFSMSCSDDQIVKQTPIDTTNTATIGLEVGNQAPAFTLKNPSGNDVTLASLRGKVVMVYFWGSWCPICIGRTDIIKNVYKKYSANNFTIYGVAVYDREAPWKEYIVSKELTWSHGIDTGDKVSTQYQIQGMSSYYLLDTKGTIIAKGSATDISSNTLELQVAAAVK